MFVFSTSILMFWIKGKIEIDSRFVNVEIPNTVLGIFPLGKKRDSVPVHTISNLQIDNSFKMKPILIGLFLLFISFGMLGDSFFGGLILGAISLGISGSGILTTLTFDKSGSKQAISVPFFEAKKLEAAQTEIYSLISNSADGRDLGLYFEKK